MIIDSDAIYEILRHLLSFLVIYIESRFFCNFLIFKIIFDKILRFLIFDRN